MLFGEWNWEDALAYARQEAWQGGRQEEREKSQKIISEQQSQLKASSAQIQALREENRRLREGR